MNNAELDIAIKANADQLLSTINKVTARLDDLSNKINSLPAGDKQLNKLSREFARTSVTQQKLINQFDNLGTATNNAAPKLEQLGSTSKSARTTLTSLSLAIQDLPFGFIGIQNNLPGVIQGFGTLTATTNGKVLPALKAIGQSLIGPAGIFLAFSAVTSIVTELIQDYGSLGAALEALFGIQKSLTSQIREFNKEYDDFLKKQQTTVKVTQDATASQAGQLAVIQSLTKRATDLTLSQQQQKNAVEELQKIDKDFFGNLEYGKSTVNDIQKATEKYTKVLIAKSKIEAYKDEISATQKLIEENKRLKNAQDSVVASDKNRSYQGQIAVGVGNEIVGNIISQNLAIKSNAKEQQNLIDKGKILQSTVDNYKKLIDEQTAIIADNSTEFQKAAKSVKEYFEAYKPSKEYIDFFKDISPEGRRAKGIEVFNDLANLDLSQGTNSVKKFNELLGQLDEAFPEKFSNFIVSSPSDLKNAFLALRGVLQEELRNMEQDIIDAKLNKQLTTQFYDSLDFVKDSLKRIREELKKTQKSLLDPIPASTENIIGLGPGTYEEVMAPVLKMQEDMKKARENFLRNFQDISNILNDVFFQPLQDQFLNLINTGKINLKEFSKVVVENLKALTAKIIATGIITLLGMIITGGFSAETLKATKLTGFQLFGKAFAGALGFGGAKSANFGGINPGGLAMSGAVSLSLRGSDLVGAINRTNTNINRIG